MPQAPKQCIIKLMLLNDNQRTLIQQAHKILILQAENPDGDSIGSAIALDEIFHAMGKSTCLQCPVQTPTYLRYITGWDRVQLNIDPSCDMAIIVDTSAKTLMGKTTDDPAAMNFLNSHPVLVLDHHVGVDPDLPFKADYIISNTAVSTGELIFDICQEEGWPINQLAAESIYISIQADSLGLTTPATTANSFLACGELVKLGVRPDVIENARRELMKKSPRILAYKGKLIDRIEYFNNQRTALISIPFSEIHEYSNEYNPTMLVLDEMRLVTGVDLAIGLKTYPDGKLTGKIRSNIPIANLLAKIFGGDGHPYASGFRTYSDEASFLPELTAALDRLYTEYDNQIATKTADQAVRQAINAAEATTEHATLQHGNNLGNFKVK